MRIPPMSRTHKISIAVCLLLAGCVATVGTGDPRSAGSSAPGRVLVHGRINYVVDGRMKTPYSAFRPAWQAPFISALQLETGEVFAFPAVDNADGSFAWEAPPGSYVISRIGAGSITDSFGTFIAWPRVAFRVAPGARKLYLGHLVLAGTSYSERTTLSTGREVHSSGIRYQFRVVDESGGNADAKALMFHDPGMPIGVQLQERWERSRTDLIESIFGK